MKQRNNIPSKRVDIVRLKIVKEASIQYNSRKITCPSDAALLSSEFISDADRESVLLICLDTKSQPTSISTVSIGSLNASVLHPREVLKIAILSNAAAIILAHNHPSGDLTESKEDVAITKRLHECCTLLGINLADHLIIVSDGQFVSLREKGYIP